MSSYTIYARERAIRVGDLLYIDGIFLKNCVWGGCRVLVYGAPYVHIHVRHLAFEQRDQHKIREPKSQECKNPAAAKATGAAEPVEMKHGVALSAASVHQFVHTDRYLVA